MPFLGHESMLTAVPSSSAVVATAEGIRLSPRAADGSYDPSAKLPAAGAYVTFPNLAVSGLRSVWGLAGDMDDADAAVADDGAVDFQLSYDDGATWRRWGGAAWVADGGWSDAAETNANIAAFPIGKGAVRGIRLRMRLRPDATLRKSPVVRDIGFLVEWDHEPADDLLRSVKAALDGVRIDVRCREAADGTNKVAPSTFGYAVDPAKGIRVWNLTADPGRGTDLFQSWDAGTKIATLTGAQPSGNILEVRFSGGAETHLVTDATLYLTHMPVMELRFAMAPDEKQSGGVVVESNKAADVARQRPGPRWRRADVSVTCVDKDEERALAMARAARELFEDSRILSLATARPFRAGDVDTVRPRAILGDGVFAPAVSARIWLRDDSRTYVQTKLARSVAVRTSQEVPNDVWYDETLTVDGT